MLIPISPGPDGPELLFTRRAWHMRNHTGEVSFPGGRLEPADLSLETTALRETEEEVGIDPSLVTVVGEITRLTTVSSPAYIVPFVGHLAERPETTINPDEVDGILHVPVAELLDPAIYRQEIWTRDGQPIEITFFELVGDTLWGATARMVRDLLERVTAAATAEQGS